jgi:hypothetical protein
MVSMLPVSGAEQLKTSLAQGTRPMISASGAYSWFGQAQAVVRPSRCRPQRSAAGTGSTALLARLRLELLDRLQRRPALAGGGIGLDLGAVGSLVRIDVVVT